MNKIFTIAFFVILLDQLFKIIARKHFVFVKNTGAAFGILKGYNLFFIIAAIIVILLISYYSIEYDYVFLGLILGGAVGNLIDRMLFGYVVDFISLGFFPSFNIADIANTIGAILLIIYWMWPGKSL